MMRSLILFLFMVFGFCGSVYADGMPGESTDAAMPANTTGGTAKSNNVSSEKAAPESPEDKEYQAKMIPLSNAIAQKITEIQAKQQELQNEIYPASKPAIQADLDNLNRELDALKMQKEQLEAQKTAREMVNKLSSQNAK